MLWRKQMRQDVFEKFNIADLCSGDFSDVMDKLYDGKYRHQIAGGFQRNHNIVAFWGRARTVLIETIETNDENIQKGLSFLGSVGKNEILVVKGSQEFAYFGEMMTKLSTNMGIEGAVIDGLTRDTNYTHRDDVSFQIVAKGYSPVDIKGRGRVRDTDVTVEIGGVVVNPGDLIYVDNDAVCVVPQEIEDEVLEKLEEKVNEEKRISGLLKKKISVEDLLKQVSEF